MLTWTEVADSLAPWRNYWISTVDAAGAPHSSPVWGAVVADVFWFFTEDTTVKHRNLVRDPRLVVHLESGDDVVIVRGTAELRGRPGEHPDIVAAFAAKYLQPDDAQYLPAATDVLNVFYVLRPASALVWLLEGYEESQRRWVAPADTVERAAEPAAGPAMVSDASS
jgi:PPOX class probable F420-dependent enzyme